MGPGVGLRDPASLGPQHCRAVLLALVLDGRLQRCKRAQESAQCAPNSPARGCRGVQTGGMVHTEHLIMLQTRQEQEIPPVEAYGVFMARQDTSTVHCAVHELNTALHADV